MGTVTKAIADGIIAGAWPEDQCVKIVKYTNAFNGQEAYGCIYKGQCLDKYQASEFIIDPVTYWEVTGNTRQYTVIALWSESFEQFAASYITSTPEQAVDLAHAEYEEEGGDKLTIAGVVTIEDGKIAVVL